MDVWDADEDPTWEPDQSGPEYEMWREAQTHLRLTPCYCGYYNTKKALYCLKCEYPLLPYSQA